MKLTNVSARPHWLGNVLIAPGATEEVGDEWDGAFNAAELKKVAAESVETEVADVKRGRKAKTAE